MELQTVTLAVQPDILQQAEIKILKSRPAHEAFAYSAEGARRRHSEGGDVQVIAARRRGTRPGPSYLAAHQLRPLRVDSGLRRILPCEDGQGTAGLGGEDACQLPR